MGASRSNPVDSSIQPYSIIFRIVGAIALTAALVTFLVFTRWLTVAPEPDQIIREMASLPPVAPPAPEPPTSETSEPEPVTPPQQVPDLPQLELQVEQIAPPIRAIVDKQTVDFAMQSLDFELEMDPVVQVKKTTRSKKASYSPPKTISKAPSRSAPKPAPRRTTFSSSELDGKPRLLNRPRATYPASMLRKGVRSGKVLLEVSISPSGKCSVRRVISSTHGDFSAIARSFANSARFSSPKKDGRAVTAIYKWPLVLKP